MFIGDHIKELRKQKHMTLVELAHKSGVQIATLSRIENKKMVGTLESHLNIAKALNVDVTQLYANIREDSSTEAKEKEKKLTESFVHNDKASMEILTTKLFSKKMMPSLIRIEPGGQTTPEENSVGTEKFIFVLEGKIEVSIDSQMTPLSKNSSFYFDAARKHYFKNTGAKVAKMLCVCTPVAL